MSYYFDYMASTPIEPQVSEIMQAYACNPNLCANPSAKHSAAQQAKKQLELATKAMLGVINADIKDQLIFTSGATEAINLALIGSAKHYKRNGNHIISLTTEHHATLNTLKNLAKDGFNVDLLNPNSNGLVDIKKLKETINKQTILITIAHVNNEIGTIQDIKSIATICQEHGIMLHIDAAQTIGKCTLDVQEVPADFISFSAHKYYGPKGIGALYIKHKRKIKPLLHGGGQQQQLRPGTILLMLILAMAKTWELSTENNNELQHIAKLHKIIKEALPRTVSIHGDTTMRVPHNLMISLPNSCSIADIEKLKYTFNISSASACSISKQSHVLRCTWH